MDQSHAAPSSLNATEWVGYLRFMREELESVSPEAAEHLRQAERTLLRQAAASVSPAPFH